MIHIVKGLGIINKVEIDVFLELSCFFMIQRMLAIWSLVPLPFLKPLWKSGRSQFMYCWSLVWRILSITLLACEMSAIVRSFEHSLALPFFRIGMKANLFQSCGHCGAFQICWHIECSTFTASSFRIWNSSTGIPLPPLALFVVMLSKSHLTLQSRMSGYQCDHTIVIILVVKLFFVQFFCVFLSHLLNIFCFVRSYHFCPLSSPSLHEMFPWYL